MSASEKKGHAIRSIILVVQIICCNLATYWPCTARMKLRVLRTKIGEAEVRTPSSALSRISLTHTGVANAGALRCTNSIRCFCGELVVWYPLPARGGQ